MQLVVVVMNRTTAKPDPSAVRDTSVRANKVCIIDARKLKPNLKLTTMLI